MTDDTTGGTLFSPTQPDEASPSKPERKSKTKAEKFAAEAFRSFEDDSPETRAFYARFLIQAGMPYSNPGDIPHWTRVSGYRQLTLQPGFNLDPDASTQPNAEPTLISPIGYPYGIHPRYFMTWVATEAVKTRSRYLYTGRSMNKFLEKMGLTSTGGPRGNISRVTSQFWRLLTSRITLTTLIPNENRREWESITIADSIRVWGNPTSPGSSLAGAEIVLSERCFTELTEHSVPYNPFALHQFTGSAFQFDIYMWLVHRLYSLNQREKSTLITWKQLQGQFGSTSKDTRYFRHDFLRALTPVRHVYKEARITVTKTGILLHPSPPHRSIVS